jgi:hypothetical protein
VQTFKDSRGGILLRAATLTSGKAWSDPIARGVYVRRRILCANLPSPSAAILASREMQLLAVDHTQMGNRDIVTGLTQPVTCMGCHSQINPIGFTLEGFGPLGELRSQESIFDANGKLLAQHPINTQVANLGLDAGQSVPAGGPNDLISAISQSDGARSCFATQLFLQARYRPASAADGCTLNGIRQSLMSGKTVKETLINNIANDEIFWRGL